MNRMPTSDRLVYALTKYAQRGASSRVRFRNLTPQLTERGWSIQHFPLLSDDILASFYRRKAHRRADDQYLPRADAKDIAHPGAAGGHSISNRRRGLDLSGGRGGLPKLE